MRGEGTGFDRLLLVQAYTFSDFHFQDSPIYGSNSIAGTPLQFYKAEHVTSIRAASISEPTSNGIRQVPGKRTQYTFRGPVRAARLPFWLEESQRS